MKLSLAVAGMVAVVLCSIIAVAYVKRQNPVLLAIDSDVRDGHGIQILNPFRQRAPERAADSFLTRLSSADCSGLLTRLGDAPSLMKSVCDSEQMYPMKGWRLEAIGQDGDRTLLRYAASRNAGTRRVKDPLWIWLTKNNNEEYQVTGYEPWY